MNLNSDDFITMEAACNEPYEIFDDQAILRQNVRTSNPVSKIKAREEKALKLSALEKDFTGLSNTQRRKKAY